MIWSSRASALGSSSCGHALVEPCPEFPEVGWSNQHNGSPKAFALRVSLVGVLILELTGGRGEIAALAPDEFTGTNIADSTVANQPVGSVQLKVSLNKLFFAKAKSPGLYLGLLPTWGDKRNKKLGQGPVIFAS